MVYTLISSDGEEFRADGHSIKQSKVLGLAAKNLESADTPIQVEKVKGDTMRRVLEWCENHRDDGPYVSKCGPALRLPHWDFRWLKDLDNQQLFDLITATNDLQMRQLMDYSCKTVANMAKGKNPEQLRQIFGIMSDEEEAELALHEPGPSNATH
uniref:Skp1-related protein n=1 Tax=Caenorhabditis tropicalis TaxID=1561998 RepID=A0A1I7V0A2_9PELO